jgi:serine-threonine kinase receptor-associated protein
MAAVAANPAVDASTKSNSRQIPIVCPGHTRPLAELQFCSCDDRTFLISACHDRMPMVRDGLTGDWIGTFAGHKGAVWSCRMDPKGVLAATASGDFSVKVWDAITGAALWEFPHKHIVKCVDFDHDSKRLATGGHEGLLRIYTLPKDEPQVIPQHPTKKIVITKCNWLKDNTVLAAGKDGVIRFWDLEKPESPVATLQVDSEVRDMEISPDETILTVAAGNKVYFFNLETKKLVHAYPMPIHFREEGGASLHPSKTKFVAGGSDLWVRVFDFETGKELETLKGHHGPIRCVRYAPDGKTYATGSEDGTIRLWKTDPE